MVSQSKYHFIVIKISMAIRQWKAERYLIYFRKIYFIEARNLTSKGFSSYWFEIIFWWCLRRNPLERVKVYFSNSLLVLMAAFLSGSNSTICIFVLLNLLGWRWFDYGWVFNFSLIKWERMGLFLNFITYFPLVSTQCPINLVKI